MTKAANDNTDTWIELAAATANLVRYLEGSKEHQGDGERNAPRQRTEEEKAEDQRRYIEQRLREIAAFEKRYGRKGRS